MKKNHHVEMIKEGQINLFEADYQVKKQEALKVVEEAVAKLEKEMQMNKVHPYLLIVGNYVRDYVKANPSTAEKILDENKTIVGSMNEMRKAAEKVQVENCRVLTSEQGFEIVLKYFGIKGTGEVTDASKATP